MFRRTKSLANASHGELLPVHTYQIPRALLADLVQVPNLTGVIASAGEMVTPDQMDTR